MNKKYLKIVFLSLLIGGCSNSITSSSLTKETSSSSSTSTVTSSISSSSNTNNSSSSNTNNSSSTNHTNHTKNQDWNNDSVEHWHQCECGELVDVENHTFEIVLDNDNNEIEKCNICGYISSEWFSEKKKLDDYAYSFAVVGDTQIICRKYPEHMDTIYDWIIDNKDDKNIQYVFGLGDITDTWKKNDTKEWDIAKEAIAQLDGVLPYSLTRGNHDENLYFNQYFDYDAYRNQFDGFYNDEINDTYRYFTIGETNYLFLTLDYGPDDERLEWANEVIASHPNHKVIITTHGYLYGDGTPIGVHDTAIHSTSSVIDYDKTRIYRNGDEMWDKLVSRHSNISLIMSGHVSTNDVVVSKATGIHGNKVTQLLVNPQGMDANVEATGMVCMLYFNEKGDEVQVEYFSTIKEQFYKQKNQYSFTLENNECEAHEYASKHDNEYHWLECECGYIHKKSLHDYDNGILTNNKTLLYTCECGFNKETSNTKDETTLKLQELFTKYYNDGIYYKDTVVNLDETKLTNINSYFDDSTSLLERTTYYNRKESWILNNNQYDGYGTSDDNHLVNFAYTFDGIKVDGKLNNSLPGMEDYFVTLNDFRLGVHSPNNTISMLDGGWNYNNNVYESKDINVLEAFKLFTAPMYKGNISFSKATVELVNDLLVMKLWTNASNNTTLINTAESDGINVVFSYATIGKYCFINLLDVEGNVFKNLFEKANDEGVCSIVAPSEDGLVASNDKLIIDTKDEENIKNIYYSELSEYSVNDYSDKFMGSGNSADPYLINNGNDFALFNKLISEGNNFEGYYFRLMNSIDLNNTSLILGDFAGHFDGNNCSIRGLSITSNAENIGLFSKLVYGGSIKNLNVYGTVTANAPIDSNLTQYVGGIVGISYGNILNCNNYTTIIHNKKYAGGIAGRTSGIIENCNNYGSITSSSTDRKAGIVGLLNNWGSVKNCNNYADIYGTNTTAGIAAEIYNSNTVIENSNNYGNIIATSYNVGGIVGLSNTLKISNCNNYGDVTSNSECIGGIGGTSNGVVSYCENYGVIKSNGQRGGIIGKNGGRVEYCINFGLIELNSSSWNTGGIVGESAGDIYNCINNGDVVGKTTHIGGIVGSTSGKTINCTNYGNVSNVSWGGGGIAGNSSNEISNCANYGDVSGSGQLGGIVGKASGLITNCTNYGNINGTSVSTIGGICGNITVDNYSQDYKNTLLNTNINNGTSAGNDILGK